MQARWMCQNSLQSLQRIKLYNKPDWAPINMDSQNKTKSMALLPRNFEQNNNRFYIANEELIHVKRRSIELTRMVVKD